MFAIMSDLIQKNTSCLEQLFVSVGMFMTPNYRTPFLNMFPFDKLIHCIQIMINPFKVWWFIYIDCGTRKARW